MEYLKKELGSYNLHLIKTKKFKTTTVSISFREPIIKDEITIRNVLCDLFTSSTANYPSKRDLIIKAQDLYGASVNCRNSKKGNYITTDFSLSVLKDKYTEDGNYEDSVKFMFDMIFNPDIENNEFKKDKIDVIKNIAKNAILSIKENPRSYALSRMAEIYGEDSVVSYNMMGYLDDLDKITGEDLYKYYLKMLDTNMIEVFVIGDIDFDDSTSFFKTILDLKVFKKEKISHIVDYKKIKSKPVIVKEENDTSQSSLVMGYTLNDLSVYERNYSLSLFNVIFGGGADSKLFKDVREANSLCYYIFSNPNKLDNMLIVRAGIDRNNFDKTIKLIENNLKDMCKGNFSDSEIDIAKEYYLTALDELLESPSHIISNYYMSHIIGTDDIDVKREKIVKVSKEEIVEVAKKVKLDTIYLLEGVSEIGDNNEEN